MICFERMKIRVTFDAFTDLLRLRVVTYERKIYVRFIKEFASSGVKIQK